MMLSLLPLVLLPCALAAPTAPDDAAVHIPLVRRTTTVQDRVANLPHAMDAVRLKYGFQPVNQKRSTTSGSLTDEENDSSYSAVVSIGTPAQDFNLILDTGKSLGSSDLWVAIEGCSTCTSSVPLFDPAKSSSYKNDSSTLDITYGSGQVGGYVSQETVSFTGFSMTQEFLAVAATTSDLLDDGLSGIMGLGWESLSALQTTPFWQQLYTQNQLSSPVFSFYLERWVDAAATETAPGGTFTLGGTNTSLYSGSVEFNDIPSGSTASYWLQQVSTLTIQGKSVSISSSDGLAAIDTGTTLIGAPSSLMSQIWANVPGSVALSGQYEGMYAFPCSTNVSVSISFGGTSWPISPDDMNLGTVSGTGSSAMCAGAIFDVGSTVGASGQGVPSWIVGDTFLKNVYSVFQASPAAVGFATLASGLNGASGTTGSSPSTVSGSPGVPLSSGTSGSTANVASPSAILPISLSALVSLLSAFFLAF